MASRLPKHLEPEFGANFVNNSDRDTLAITALAISTDEYTVTKLLDSFAFLDYWKRIPL